ALTLFWVMVSASPPPTNKVITCTLHALMLRRYRKCVGASAIHSEIGIMSEVVLLRFADLKKMGIVKCWPTLLRWIENEGFPPGKLLGPNTRVFPKDEVLTWVASRPEKKGGERC